MNTEIVKNSFTYEISKELTSYNIYTINQSSTPLKIPFTEQIRIENFRGFSNGSGFNKYLRFKDCSNWNKSEQVTGLFPYKSIFYGNRRVGNVKSLIVFVFDTDTKNLKIDYYENFYPNKDKLNSILDTYN